MSWVETHSPSFTARHESSDERGAREVLDALEGFRARLDSGFERTPGDVTVVIHPSYAQLAVAQPWLPLARLASAPAGRRYFGGWFSQAEIHVLTPELLRRRASEVAGSREALELAPLHEYAHLVVGANNAELPPPFRLRATREYLRWAWLHEGAATWLSGQQRHLGPAIARRLREGPSPGLPPTARDAALLGGSLFALLAEERGVDACLALVRRPLDPRGGAAAVEQAFGASAESLRRTWRDWLQELAARDRR